MYLIASSLKKQMLQFVFLLRILVLRTGALARQVKVLAAEPDDLSLILRPTSWKESTSSLALSSAFHASLRVTNTRVHTVNQWESFVIFVS